MQKYEKKGFILVSSHYEFWTCLTLVVIVYIFNNNVFLYIIIIILINNRLMFCLQVLLVTTGRENIKLRNHKPRY